MWQRERNSWSCFTLCWCACSTQHFSFNQELIWELLLKLGIKKGENVLWNVFLTGLLISEGFVSSYGLPLVLVFWKRANDTIVVLLVKM